MNNKPFIERIISLFIIILFGIITIIICYSDATRGIYVYLTKGSRDTADEISRGNSILQEVPYHTGDFGYSFLFTTYGHKVSGEVTIHAVGKTSGFTYIDQTVPGKKFKNNEFVDFMLPEICPSDDETIIFTFSSTSDPTSGLTLLITDDDSMPGYDSLFNGDPMYTDAVTRVITPSRGAILSVILIIAISLVTYILICLLFLGSLQIQKIIFTFFTSLFLFLLFLSLITLNLQDPFFDTDEGDIFVTGNGIAYGYDLYTDLHSQHMPFSYYLSALFWKLGANSIFRQRFAFYCFFALMWSIIINRYKKTVPAFSLILYPFLFLLSIKQYFWGTTILSEHLAGIGFVILLLETLQFCRTELLRVDNSIFISLSIVLTFGTIFIAAYAVFAAAIWF